MKYLKFFVDINEGWFNKKNDTNEIDPFGEDYWDEEPTGEKFKYDEYVNFRRSINPIMTKVHRKFIHELVTNLYNDGYTWVGGTPLLYGLGGHILNFTEIGRYYYIFIYDVDGVRQVSKIVNPSKIKSYNKIRKWEP